MRADIARLVIAAVAVAATVIVMVLTGWADDRASPGSGGRVPVPDTATERAP